MRDADEFIELAACSTGSQGLLSQTDAIGDGVGHATAIKGRTGVERDDVACRAGLIIQDAQQHVARLFAVLDAELAVGIDRVIIGSMAVKNPVFVEAALDRFGSSKIVIGIDAKEGLVATEGWLETSSQDYISLALAMEKIGVRLFVYTDVDRDGTLTGPNIQHYQKLLAALKQAQVIASGGIQSADDLDELKKLGLAGAIVGKAYYSGRISLEQIKEAERG